jgi:hypothetical protein
MKENEISQALQKAWDESNCCEIVLTREDLSSLIELLMDIFEQHVTTQSSQPISLQFLGYGRVNSAFITNIKTTRLHTMFKYSLGGLAENCKITTTEEIKKEILDFENKIGDILEAIVQG